MRPRILALLVGAALILTGVACDDGGTGTGATTSTTARAGGEALGGAGDVQAVCDALKPVADLNQQAAALTTFEERRQFLLDHIDDSSAAYEQAAEVAEDGPVKSSIEVLRAYNDDFLQLLEENETEAELSEAIIASNTGEPEQAAVVLNDFTTQRCGFAVGS